MKVPRNFNGRNAQSRRDLAIALAARVPDPRPRRARPRRGAARTALAGGGREDATISRLRAEIRAPPVPRLPGPGVARPVGRAPPPARRGRRTALRRRIESRTNTIARQFDRVCDVLTSLGYLEDDEVTAAGRTLMRIYTEMDLVAAECLRRASGRGSTRPSSRPPCRSWSSRPVAPTTPPRRGCPADRVRDVVSDMVSLWADLDRLERDHRLEFLREPDLGFAWAAQAWASGAGLDDVLRETDLAAGDFVRWMKQLLDLAGQVADAAGGRPASRLRRAPGDRAADHRRPAPRSRRLLVADRVTRGTRTGLYRRAHRRRARHPGRVRPPVRWWRPDGSRRASTARSWCAWRRWPRPGCGPAGPRGRPASRPGS